MSENDSGRSSPSAEPSLDDAAFQGFEDSDSLLWQSEFGELFDGPLQPEPWQEPATSDHIDLPPDRVRFATLATLRLLDRDARVDGVITNLSSEGLACVTAADLDPGTQVEISFQMDLSEEPLLICAEVLWRRYPDDGDPCYGLRFLELSQEQDDAIMGFIRERTEGRASEWSMPALPILEGETQPPRGRLAFASTVGLSAGVGLALLVALIPSWQSATGIGMEPSLEPAAAGVNFKASADIPATAEQLSGEAEIIKKTASELAPEPAPPKLVSKAKPSAIAEVAKPEPAVVSNVLPKAEPKASTLQPVVEISMQGDGENVELLLRTSHPVTKHRSFWLKNPRRFVVDVPGGHNAFAKLSYDLNHPLAEKLRVGQHADKVRFVVEVSDEVLRKATLTPSETGVVLGLQRR